MTPRVSSVLAGGCSDGSSLEEGSCFYYIESVARERGARHRVCLPPSWLGGAGLTVAGIAPERERACGCVSSARRGRMCHFIIFCRGFPSLFYQSASPDSR